MLNQQTLAATGFEKFGKTTGRATFLAEMEQVVPWRLLCALIEPVYPKPGNGRPPGGAGADAADLLSAALVQSLGPGAGRGPLRVGLDAKLRGH
jgi:hypothetical protein